jgi:RNA 2',3'-cyclic 3'-phosphodiesterase
LSKAITKVADNHNNFDLVLKGCGIFKSFHNPTAIWTGLEAGDTLQSIKSELDIELKKLGFSIENRIFMPHLTIGRPKSIDNIETLKTLFQKYENKVLLKQEINQIILFESILRPLGPIYKELYLRDLKQKATNRN